MMRWNRKFKNEERIKKENIEGKKQRNKKKNDK